jgi:hypothetical protein
LAVVLFFMLLPRSVLSVFTPMGNPRSDGDGTGAAEGGIVGLKEKPVTQPEWTVPKYMIDEGDPALASAYERPMDPDEPETPEVPEDEEGD